MSYRLMRPSDSGHRETSKVSTPKPQAAPRSDLSVAHELFGALWGLIFLGAMRSVDRVPIPFSPWLDEFIDSRQAKIDAVLSLVQCTTSLSSASMATFDEQRANWHQNLATGAGFGGWLSLYSRNRGSWPVNFDDADAVRRLVLHGVECQLSEFVGAMILAVAERRAIEPQLLSSIQSAARSAAELGGALDPALAAQRAYEVWCVARLGDFLLPGSGTTDEARLNLRLAADGLDVVFPRHLEL